MSAEASSATLLLSADLGLGYRAQYASYKYVNSLLQLQRSDQSS